MQTFVPKYLYALMWKKPSVKTCKKSLATKTKHTLRGSIHFYVTLSLVTEIIDVDKHLMKAL